MKNRLKLDFSLETAEERLNFINNYIVQFTDLTPSESETISNYLLWGKTKEGIPLGADCELETRWTKTNDIDSLDSLIESQTFSDSQIHGLNNATLYRKPREVFNRAQVRKNAPEHLLKVFEELWRNIDRTDLLINYYEMRIGKRTKPPRDELVRRFDEEERAAIEQQAQKLNQYTYLKRRHDLIEMRKEQFSLRDSFMPTMIGFGSSSPKFSSSTLVFEQDIEVLPLGIVEGAAGRLIFDKDIDPAALNEEQLRKISDLIQKKKNPDSNKFIIDFRDSQIIYQLYLFKEELLDQAEEEKVEDYGEGNLDNLLKTLDFYEEIADLTDIQREILHLKQKHEKNIDISTYINKKYNKNYTANYISTIFKQKIVVKIAEAAALHYTTIENIFYPENFKRCNCCGRLLLLDSRNWVKKARSRDGFQNKCKRCERVTRKSKKGGAN